MRLWLVFALGCQAGDSPPQAKPVPVIRDAAVAIDAGVDARRVDAAVPPPADERLAALPMTGPFASRDKLCAAQTCPPERAVACAKELPGEIQGTEMEHPPAPFSEVFLQAVGCLASGNEFLGNGRYHVVVHRADGYYVGKPVLTLTTNPKYCAISLEASWQVRDKAILLGITAHQGCLACNKQGNELDGVEVLAVIANGTTPLMFRPLVTAQHHHQKPAAPGSDCPVEDRDVTLSPSWDGGTLTLRGAAVWRRPIVADDGSIMVGAFEADPPVASAAGTYRLALP